MSNEVNWSEVTVEDELVHPEQDVTCKFCGEVVTPEDKCWKVDVYVLEKYVSTSYFCTSCY